MALPDALITFWNDTEAASAVEYALLAALVFAVAAVGVVSLRDEVLGMWDTSSRTLVAAIQAGLN